MRKLLMLLVLAAPIQAQTPDTTYSVGPDLGNAAGIYPHYFRLTRRDSLMGVVLQGNANAGSCANAWCAIVSLGANSMSQSGGTFGSFNAAAHEVVRVWNSTHPGDTLSTPVVVPPVVVPPVDTTPKPPVVTPPDTTTAIVATTRITCPAGKYRTCYSVTERGVQAGRVYQYDTTAARRWIAGRGVVDFTPRYTTLTAAAERVILDWHITTIPSDSTPKVDTTHKTITVYDTVRTTITMPPDTLRPRVIMPVDTIYMRAGDPPLILQTGDTIKLPIRVLPKCSCTSSIDTATHLIPAGVAVKDAGVDTVGLHIYDWPSRVGSNSVYLGTQFLGQVIQDAAGQWFAYRKIADQMVMPRDSVAYATKAAAMQALAGTPTTGPASPGLQNPQTPELPRSVIP